MSSSAENKFCFKFDLSMKHRLVYSQEVGFPVGSAVSTVGANVANLGSCVGGMLLTVKNYKYVIRMW